MSETNSKVAEIDDKENRFHRLPEDIIILIFNKIVDLMCLCSCSLVSKQFAAVIFQYVRTVSITIPDCGSYDEGCLHRMQKFTDKLKDSTVEITPSLLDSYSLQHLKLPVFLHKFREIKFINLNYEYTENNTKSIFPMGKIKVAHNSAQIERFVALVPSSVYKDDEEEPDQGEGSNDHNLKVSECLIQLNGRHAEWMCLILILIKCHRSLHGVTINCPEGKLVIVDEQLYNIHRHMYHILKKPFLSNPIIRNVKLPVLHLPLSGYMLKRLSLWILDAPGDSHENEKRTLQEIVFWDCDDQSAVLYEAIKEILRKHRADIRII